MFEQYQRCHTAMLADLKRDKTAARVVVYPLLRTGHGWAQQSINCIYALLYAMLTKRVFLMDVAERPLVAEHVALPDASWWKHTAWQRHPELAEVCASASDLHTDYHNGSTPCQIGQITANIRIIQEGSSWFPIWRILGDLRPYILTGRVSRLLFQPAAALQRIIDTEWAPKFQRKHLVAVGIRRGLLSHDHHTTSKGAVDAFLPIGSERDETFVFECAKKMVTQNDDGASTVVMLVCDDEGVKERARKFFHDRVLINECKAVSFWHITETEQMQCVFLDWFLLGYAHDAIVSDNSAFQGTAYSRTGKVPLTVGRIDVQSNTCNRRYSEVHPLPRFTE